MMALSATTLPPAPLALCGAQSSCSRTAPSLASGQMARRDRAGRTGRCDRERVCPGAGRAAYAPQTTLLPTEQVMSEASSSGRSSRSKKSRKSRETCIEAGRGAAARDQAGANPDVALEPPHQESHPRKPQELRTPRHRRLRRRRRFRADRRAAGRAPRKVRSRRNTSKRGADMENADRGCSSATSAIRKALSPPPGRSRPDLFQPRPAGRVIDSRVVRSSGASALDEEALALLRRAQPFPPPPPELSGQRVDLTVPIRFNLK